MWKEVKKNLERSILPSDYMRILNDFPPLVAVAAVGRNEEHTVFRRCAAPDKIKIVRTGGSTKGEWIWGFAKGKAVEQLPSTS
jgi:hypothetical protein